MEVLQEVSRRVGVAAGGGEGHRSGDVRAIGLAEVGRSEWIHTGHGWLMELVSSASGSSEEQRVYSADSSSSVWCGLSIVQGSGELE